MKQPQSRYNQFFLFIFITCIYLVSKYITFKGFKGTDDLHYAMLAKNLLDGTYTPFVSSDIYSGRILLILTQALVYLAGGVNIMTTQLGTLIATILSCYLIVFKLLPGYNYGKIIIATSLFYFNPILSESNLATLPDVYVMLAGILIYLLWGNIDTGGSKNVIFSRGILIGLIAFAAMFYKENALVYIPFIICASLYRSNRSKLLAGGVATAIFLSGIIVTGFIYYSYTGNFFFRIEQIKNSSYPHPCNYSSFLEKDMIIRLTYGVWREFIIAGFYPVILACLLIAARMIFEKGFRVKDNPHVIYFIILVILGLYFPFSLSGYQPLCFRARHFLFLLPLAVVISTEYINTSLLKSSLLNISIFVSAIITGVCMINTGHKWFWMIYILLLVLFVVQKMAARRSPAWFFLGFACILWLFMPYRLFYHTSNWISNMQQLTKQLEGKYFYFPDHDNMMHWKLLNQFDTSFHTYNLEKNPFKIYKTYYETPDSLYFHPGWFIVNQKYNTSPGTTLKAIDNLSHNNFFAKRITSGDINAYYIGTMEQYRTIKKIIETNDISNCNCY